MKLVDATDKISWKSSNSKIISVSKEGIVKGISSGKATITAIHNSKKYTCNITVKKLTAEKAFANYLKQEYQDYSITYSNTHQTKNYTYKAEKFGLIDINQDGTKELLTYAQLNASANDVVCYEF